MRTLCIIILCARMVAAAKETSLSFVHPESEDWTRERSRQENYEAMRAWHATPEFHDIGHPRERRIDLNGDGRPEVFLLYAGHSYWGGYSGFTQRGGAWHFIGRVDLGGRTPARLKKRRQGWSDFTVDLEGSRGRVVRYLYMWDQKGRTYNERGKFLKEVKPAFPVNDEP
ncbi:FG-GAP repeat domain-containing protein [Verrucomicrobiota bacterium sgz303538]